MNRTRYYIRILMLMLLLVGGGMVSEAWAAKVRYHILTLPFSIRNYNNTGFYKKDIRVEALLVISDAPTIGLPEIYKSPLATNFKYYKNWETPEYTYLFHRSLNPHVLEVKHYIYSEGGAQNEITEGTNASEYTDVYVTYDYDDGVGGEVEAREIFLDKTQDYNITVGGNRFLCYNRSRNNRIANANTGALTGEDLVSEDFVVPEKENQLGFSWSTDQFAGKKGVHMGFWLAPTPYEYAPNPDPYNITIMTAYVGNETYQKDPVENEYFVKPYKGATLFSLITSNADGKGTETKMWFDCDNDLHYKGVPNSSGINDPEDDNYWAKKVDYWPGYFRHTNQPLFNSVALLNHPGGQGYVFVGSKFNQGVGNNAYKEWAPNSNGNYATLTNDNNNPFMSFKTLASSPVINIYKIRKYTLKIKTHGSKETLEIEMRWSDAKASDKIVDHLPDVFKRKYCSYKAYADEGLTTEITTFEDAKSKAVLEGERLVIWFDYTVTESFPFEALPEGGSYVNARWYTMRMNGKAEQKNIAYHDNVNNKLITEDNNGNAKGSNITANLHQGENSAEAQVAFMGDPYELKIISRAASETVGNRFIGCAIDATNGTPLSTNMTGTSDISKWEIVYESTDMGNFILRKFGTYADPMYIGWNTSEANKPVTYSSEGSRIRVVELEKASYTYHIVLNDAGDIAVKASSRHDVGKMLSSWEDIPEIIRSSFLSTATVTYHASIADAKNRSNPIASAPYDSNRDIFVRYSFVSAPTAGTFNVVLNGEYIYTSGDDINSKETITGDDANNSNYQWVLDYSDPYAMTIQNLGNGKYVKFSSWSDNTAITWVDNENKVDASRFVAKKLAFARTYEVMAATGDNTDASVTYYNIGRPAAHTIKLYSNSSYLTGNATLRFQLISTEATDVTYHLIDKAGKDLLQVTTRHVTGDEPEFPPEYYSPLVDTYHYYPLTDFTVVDETYILNDSHTELDAVIGHIYVIYDVNDLVNLKSGQLYLLKYEAGQSFKQEDGSDGLTTTPLKAIYPYVNGDGNFFIYGQEQYDLQQEGAASTRTRWAWYVQSNLGDKGDPYHVTIKSRQTETYPITNSSEYNAYFMTYKPEGYTEVVTTLAWPGMADETATEYMVLGNEGQYQLVTTNEINGSRYAVNSFEQYWKTFDTIRKKVYGESSAKENDDDPITIPLDAKATFGSSTTQTLRDYLTTELNWHSYEKWAYAKRWNGYNNGYSNEAGTHEKKKGWETIEHWYQKVDMGQGYFDFVETSIDPVLILLDQHGWEIMRKPLPASPDDPLKESKYEAIRPYNSPMVKEYAFWATAKKRTGLHQYYLLSDRIGGNDFTSTDLTDLPPYESANVKDKKGNLNDQYVTYIVRDEYAQTYNPANKEAKPFLIEQGTKYASTSDGVTIAKNNVSSVGDMKTHILNGNIPNTEKWYVKPNWNIDYEMGYGDVTHTWTKKKADGKWDNKNPNAYEHYLYKNKLTAQYIADKDSLGYFSFSNGFDPYNIQIIPISYDAAPSRKFMKTNATGMDLHDGIMHGVYTEERAVSLGDSIPVVDKANSIWFDGRKLSITNATWMAVQDADGNMQLMPRFDHTTRMSEFGPLIAPTDANVDKTYTKLYRPVVYKYRIIDNDGNESLRYKSGGDLLPQTPDHFKSPLAKDYIYYANSSLTDTIKGSLDGATLTDDIVYVRYEYDEDADRLNILKGNWMTMQLNEKNTQYTTVSSAGIYSSLSNSYSMTATDETDMVQQVKKLAEAGDYYFKVGSVYYKVIVNTAYVDEVYATYTITDGNFEGWNDSAEGVQKEAENDDAMYRWIQTCTPSTTPWNYYFQIGTEAPYTYVIVNVTSAYQSQTDATYESPTSGDYSSNWDASKPLTVNADGKKWQWKFVESPQSKPDPYAVYIFNRSKNTGTVRQERFALLSHSEGDYALAQAGLGSNPEYDYTYKFLKGNEMNTSTAAKIVEEDDFTCSAGTFHETDSQVKLTDEVQHSFTYKVYTNNGALAIEVSQTQKEAASNSWRPVLPEAAHTPLLNIEQYRYYEQDLSVATPDTLNRSLSLLYGLYDDIVYTHYTPYNDKESNYLVPNVRNDKGSNSDPVARSSKSNDAPLGLDGKRLYNIIWHPDNMMKSNSTAISCDADKELQSTAEYEWVFEGDDPYAIKIKSVGESGKYIHEATLTTTNLNSETPLTFMLLNREGYDYGVLAKTGDKNTMLSGHGNALTTSDPTKFIIFALSTYKVIYHLIIENIGKSVRIPYAELENGTRVPKGEKEISGSTLRDLKTQEETTGTHVDGDKYQLGESLSAIEVKINADGITVSDDGLFTNNYIYCEDVGHISLGDAFKVPSEFYRSNVNYDFYIGGVYNSDGSDDTSDIVDLNNEYQGLKMTNMGDDSKLLGKIVLVNIVYSFMGGLDTNSGSDFVTNVSQNKWYTFETNDATPRLAEFTGSLKTTEGYATHYTNDYLWTPVGDPYGFKMYNRYSYKNLGRANEVMTTEDINSSSVVTMVVEDPATPNANAVYELLTTNTTTPGYFIVHPVVNKTGSQYYMTNNSSTGAMTLSTTPTEWTFGLNEEVMKPYYLAAGYVGGLNVAGKAAYETAVKGTDPLQRLMAMQEVVYNHDKTEGAADNYIVHYAPGYYRLHSQPGSVGISTPRYASGYTHKTELTAGEGNTAIPMHFYEQEEYSINNPVFSDLGTANTDYTSTVATRGDIPLSTVTCDPASIFYFSGDAGSSPSSTMQTQGLYVKENKMQEESAGATSFSIVDIGGGVIALQSGDDFLKYAQNVNKYDLKFDYDANTIESTRWCMQPVQKAAKAGDGEMELRVPTNNGGNNYFYATFCAPFHVLLTNEKDEAYVVPTTDVWPTTTPAMMHPQKIGNYNTEYNGCPVDYRGSNQFIPAGTPVIIRTTNPIGYVTMALPTIATSLDPVSCMFKGTYLEQMLDHSSDYVYVFGRPLGTFTVAGDFAVTGVIDHISPNASTEVGFYVNANPNKEASVSKASWTRNNKYVYANKVYYRISSSPSRQQTRGVEFISVVFDDDDDEPIEEGQEQYVRNDNRVYDLLGRPQSQDAPLKPGIYIRNGRKVMVR